MGHRRRIGADTRARGSKLQAEVRGGVSRECGAQYRPVEREVLHRAGCWACKLMRRHKEAAMRHSVSGKIGNVFMIAWLAVGAIIAVFPAYAAEGSNQAATPARSDQAEAARLR